MDRRTDSEAGLYGANVLRLSLIAIISLFVFEFFCDHNASYTSSKVCKIHRSTRYRHYRRAACQNKR